MMKQTYRIQSSISRELKHAALKRGGLIGGVGALLLLVGGTIMPAAQLKLWGIPIFVCSLLFIAIGLYPYRQLSRLEIKPHSLQIDDGFLLFSKSKRALFKIPLQMIDHMEHVEQDQLYGIALYLKKPLSNQIVVLDRYFDFEGFVVDSASRFGGCDLFLPFFSKRSYRELEQD